MKQRSLKDYADVIMGQSPPSVSYNTQKNGLPFLQGKAEFGRLYPIIEKWCNAPTKIAEQGDVLISVRAPVGPTNICPERACIGRGLAAIRPKKKRSDNFFLLYYLRSIERQLADKGRGSTFTSINREEVETIKFPDVEYDKQLQVAQLLSKVESTLEKRRQTIRLADEFLQAVFIDMFGDPENNCKKLPIVPLGSECSVLGGKRLPKGKQFSSIKTKHPYLRVTDFQNLRIDENNLKYISDEIFLKIKQYIISKDNVYISIAGTIGLSGIIPDHLDGSNLTENAAKLVIKNIPKLNKVYLAYYLNSPYVQRNIKQKTMSVGVPKLALFRIQEVKLMLPPLPLQEEFANIVQKVERLKEKQKQSETELQNLFNALMQKAFNGSL